MTDAGIFSVTFAVAKTFYDILLKTVVKGGGRNVQKSRVLRYLSEQMSDFEKARLQLVDKFVEFDDQGARKTKGNSFVFKDQDGFNSAFADLQKEVTVIIDASADAAKSQSLQAVLEIMLDDECQTELTQQESILYSRIIDALEAALPTKK
jgi:hypothetical protein